MSTHNATAANPLGEADGSEKWTPTAAEYRTAAKVCRWQARRLDKANDELGWLRRHLWENYTESIENLRLSAGVFEDAAESSVER